LPDEHGAVKLECAMRITLCLPLFISLLAGTSGQLLGIQIPVNCRSAIPLQTFIDFALPGTTLVLSGTCSGPITINRDNLTLDGRLTAVIDGQTKDAVTINGASNVTLRGLTIKNGNNGVVANNGAHIAVIDTNVQGNPLIGIWLVGNSSASLSGGSANQNGLNGIDAEGNSSVTITGSYIAKENGVFGLNINGASSLTLTKANLQVSINTLGIQIGTSASAFISDSSTQVTVTKNFTTGLTIVSGAHMVAFGGTITATGNGVHGVSVDSKAGLDLDAAAVLNSTDNTQDGVHLEETSVLTMFNTTAFSGAPGTTTLNTQSNGGNGISALTGSGLTVIHQAMINSTSNTGTGIFVDNGSSVTLIQSTATGNGKKDLLLTFGSRADLTNPPDQISNNIGVIGCDAGTLIRGVSITCPR
jgi:hypothetical protein